MTSHGRHMSVKVSQTTGNLNVCPIGISSQQQRKHQSFALLTMTHVQSLCGLVIQKALGRHDVILEELQFHVRTGSISITSIS